jgi:uncharacterized protein with FMN-binding domain
MFMKKTLVVILSVAILGVLGIYTDKTPSAAGSAPSANNNSGGQAVQSASTAASNTADSSSSSAYKDGSYTGKAADTPYGTVQMAVVISGGRISDVNFLQMPSDEGHSREVTAFAEPLLKQTTLNRQSANIDFVSGATSTSIGYQESLQKALDQAKLS